MASTITDTTGDPDIAQALKLGVVAEWTDTLQSGIRSTVVLDKKVFVLKFSDDNAFAIQADGQWGSTRGGIFLYVRRPQDKPVNFAAASSISFNNPQDVFESSEWAQAVKGQLPGPTIDLCVFYQWPGIDQARIQDIATSQPTSTDFLKIIETVDKQLGIKPTSGSTTTSRETRTSQPASAASSAGTGVSGTGVMLSAELDLTILPSSASSVLHRLSDIDKLAGTPSITTLTLGCMIYKTTDALESLVFSASVSKLPLLGNSFLKDVDLSLALARPAPTSPLNEVLTLTGDLVLGVFNAENPWVSKGTLVIDKSKHTAELTIKRADDQTQSMVDLGAIKLRTITLDVLYTFGTPSVACKTTLSTEVVLEELLAKGKVEFDGLHPTTLEFEFPGTLDIRALFQKFFADLFPSDLPELSLTDIAFSYGWAKRALEASAKADVLGLTFDARLSFAKAGNGQFIDASGQLPGPVNVANGLLSIHGSDSPTTGASVSYIAKSGSSKGMLIDAGITFVNSLCIGVVIWDGKSIKDQQPCLQADVKLSSPALRGGGLKAHLELVKINNRTHLRVYGLDLTELQDAFNAKQLFDKIRELTQKDPCGKIDIPLNDALTNIWSPKIEMSETQPEPVPSKPLQCSFDVSCTWALKFKLTKEVVVEVDMKPFPLVMDVPQTWDDIPKQIAIAIANDVDQIVRGLLDNVDKFTEIILLLHATYQAEEWAEKAFAAWFCRHPPAPPAPHPDPPIPGPPHIDHGPSGVWEALAVTTGTLATGFGKFFADPDVRFRGPRNWPTCIS